MASPIVEKVGVSTNNRILFSDELKKISQESKEVLDWLQNYELPTGVIERLKQKPHFSKMPDKEIGECVDEFKKFIAILVINKNKNRRIEMISPVIDEIWHTFILFTKEYQEFCEKLVGRYIHHEPDIQGTTNQDALKNTNFESIRNFHEDYQKYFGDLALAWSIQTPDSEQSYQETGILNKSFTVKQILGIGILFVIDMFMSLVLIFDFYLENGAVLNYIIPIGLAIVSGGVLLSLVIKDSKIKEIIGIGIIVMIETLLILTLVFSIFCKNGAALGYVPLVAIFLFFNSILLAAVLMPSKFKNGSGSGGGCGAGVGAGCSTGGGCGGGGCGGC